MRDTVAPPITVHVTSVQEQEAIYFPALGAAAYKRLHVTLNTGNKRKTPSLWTVLERTTVLRREAFLTQIDLILGKDLQKSIVHKTICGRIVPSFETNLFVQRIYA